ncbi:MAG TPA: hypothetical protein VF268_03160 [Gammaproteobacteria bacterium]
MKHRFSLMPIAALAMFAGNASADWSFGGYVESMSLNPRVAAREGVDDTAWALGFNADYFSDNLMSASLGSALVMYDDNREFRQQVEVIGGFDDGDVRTASSDASAILIYADLGPRLTFGVNESAYFSAKAGFSTFFASERSIGSCSDCYSEDIDIDGGMYVKAALGRSFERVSIGFVYSQYLDDDKGVSDGIQFLIATGF